LTFLLFLSARQAGNSKRANFACPKKFLPARTPLHFRVKVDSHTAFRKSLGHDLEIGLCFCLVNVSDDRALVIGAFVLDGLLTIYVIFDLPYYPESWTVVANAECECQD
jgi:hypothetical protein